MYIKQVSINWDKISEESYLRNIESIRGLDKIEFHKGIICSVGCFAYQDFSFSIQ